MRVCTGSGAFSLPSCLTGHPRGVHDVLQQREQPVLHPVPVCLRRLASMRPPSEQNPFSICQQALALCDRLFEAACALLSHLLAHGQVLGEDPPGHVIDLMVEQICKNKERKKKNQYNGKSLSSKEMDPGC